MSKVDGLTPGILRIPLRADGTTIDHEKLPKKEAGVRDTYWPSSFNFQTSWTNVFDSSTIPKTELRNADLLAAYVQEAFDANQAYFTPKDETKAAERYQYRARFDAFVRETVTLVRQLIPTGLERDRALERIDLIVGPRYPEALGDASDLFPTPKNPARLLDQVLDHASPNTVGGLVGGDRVDYFIPQTLSRTQEPRIADKMQIGETILGGTLPGGFEVRSVLGGKQDGERSFDRADGLVVSLAVTLRSWDARGSLQETKKSVVLDFGAEGTGPQLVEIRPGENGKATEVLIDASRREIIERELEMKRNDDGTYSRTGSPPKVTSFRDQPLTFIETSPFVDIRFAGNHDDVRGMHANWFGTLANVFEPYGRPK